MSSTLEPQRRVLDARDVRIDHFLDELLEGRRAWVPLELLQRLGRITDEKIDLGRAEITLVNAHERASGRDFDAHFVNTLTFKPELHAGDIEGAVHEVTHGVGFASRDDEILWVVLLEHLPHALDVVASVTPITLGVHVTEVQALLLASLDVGNREGDLTRDEGSPLLGDSWLNKMPLHAYMSYDSR